METNKTFNMFNHLKKYKVCQKNSLTDAMYPKIHLPCMFAYALK